MPFTWKMMNIAGKKCSTLLRLLTHSLFLCSPGCFGAFCLPGGYSSFPMKSAHQMHICLVFAKQQDIQACVSIKANFVNNHSLSLSNSSVELHPCSSSHHGQLSLQQLLAKWNDIKTLSLEMFCPQRPSLISTTTCLPRFFSGCPSTHLPVHV